MPHSGGRSSPISYAPEIRVRGPFASLNSAEKHCAYGIIRCTRIAYLTLPINSHRRTRFDLRCARARRQLSHRVSDFFRVDFDDKTGARDSNLKHFAVTAESWQARQDARVADLRSTFARKLPVRRLIRNAF